MLEQLRTETRIAYQTLRRWGVDGLDVYAVRCLLTEVRQGLISASAELREAIRDAQTLVSLSELHKQYS